MIAAVTAAVNSGDLRLNIYILYDCTEWIFEMKNKTEGKPRVKTRALLLTYAMVLCLV